MAVDGKRCAGAAEGRCDITKAQRAAVVVAASLLGMLAVSGFERNVVLFAWLIGAGVGLPPGEDILVASIGALLATGDLTAWVAIPASIAAVVASDMLLFAGGRAARVALTDRARGRAGRTRPSLAMLSGRWEGVAIAVARFLPGMRTLVFASAGARGISRAKFLAIDTCAAIVWVPLVMTCGAAVFAFLFGHAPQLLEARL